MDHYFVFNCIKFKYSIKDKTIILGFHNYSLLVLTNYQDKKNHSIIFENSSHKIVSLLFNENE